MSITTNIIKGTAKGVLFTIPGASILVSIAEEIHGGILQERFDDWKESVELRLRMLTDMQLKQLPKNEIFATEMSQGRVIDIMTFNSYSLQNYSFWKGTRIIGLFSLSHEQNLTFRLSERKIKLA